MQTKYKNIDTQTQEIESCKISQKNEHICLKIQPFTKRIEKQPYILMNPLSLCTNLYTYRHGNVQLQQKTYVLDQGHR